MSSNQTFPACADIIDVSAFNHCITLPAAVIILVLALLEKRRFRPEICGGRPALIIPLPLLDGYDNRFSYAAAFGAVTNNIVSLFLNSISNSFNGVALWAKALVLQFQVLEICITCFPLFACISTQHRLVGSVLGAIYSSVFLGSTLAEAVQYYSMTDPTLTVIQAILVLTYFPIVLCFLYLILKFLHAITECLKSNTYVINEPLKRVYPHQQQYVRRALHKDYKPSMEATTCDKLLYRSVPGFKYPVRIISVVFILLVLLYKTGITLILLGVRITPTLESLLGPLKVLVHIAPPVVDILIGVFYVTVILCLVVTAFNIYLFMKSYRRHLLRMFRGNKIFILDQLPKAHKMMARSMHFPGYQVAYMLWGFVVLFIALFSVVFISALAVYMLTVSNMLSDVLIRLSPVLGVSAAFVILLFYIQVVLARYVLMQEKIKATDDTAPLNVDNRRFYECFNYYAFLGNLAIGLFSCFRRILQGLILGLLMVGRLDHSIYARGWEHIDTGYLSYICMLHVENAHNHPMLRVFCDLLLTDLERDRQHQTPKGPVRRNTRGSRRWYVAYTLINNPELAERRKRVLNESNSKRRIIRNTHAEMESAADWPIDGGIGCSTEYVSSGRNVVTNHISS